VGLLRGYGNAIVPQVAAEFILAAEEALILARLKCEGAMHKRFPLRPPGATLLPGETDEGTARGGAAPLPGDREDGRGQGLPVSDEAGAPGMVSRSLGGAAKKC